VLAGLTESSPTPSCNVQVDRSAASLLLDPGAKPSGWLGLGALEACQGLTRLELG
jgi:hypothetical protein